MSKNKIIKAMRDQWTLTVKQAQEIFDYHEGNCEHTHGEDDNELDVARCAAYLAENSGMVKLAEKSHEAEITWTYCPRCGMRHPV